MNFLQPLSAWAQQARKSIPVLHYKITYLFYLVSTIATRHFSLSMSLTF